MSKVTTLPAFYIPGLTEDDIEQFTPLEFGSDGTSVKMRSPVLTPELLTRIIADLRKAREEYLIHQPIAKIVETIDKAINLWADPSYPPCKLAQELLPTITGFSEPMIAAILGMVNNMFSAESLNLLFEDELGDPRVLDEFRPRPKGGFLKAFGPGLTTIVFAGNAPGLPMMNTIYGFLTKSAVLGKSSSQEPLFAPLFAQTIAEIDPNLARCMAMVSWKGGDKEIERIAFGQADAVVVYGTDHSCDEVRKQVPPGVKFIRYGHKLSFGVIGREALSRGSVKDTAANAATDASVLDQQGCLSPHLFYVEEGGDVSPRDFSRYLAEAMETFNRQIPRGRLSADESAHINQLRGSYEFREFGEEGIALHVSPKGTSWTVIYEQDQTFLASCLNRTIRVKPVKDAMDVVKLVTPVKAYLQTMGVALPLERLIPLADEMGKLGLDRIPALGKMAAPSLLWRHDGRFNLLELIRWTGIE